MTSARIVTPGQAMAKTPKITARMPTRINEVDEDLNMTRIPFACLSRTTPPGKSVVRAIFSRHDGRRFRPTPAAYRGIAGGYGRAPAHAGEPGPAFPLRPPCQPVTYRSSVTS